MDDAAKSYRQSDFFKKSQNGFDRDGYRAWEECWATWVIPLQNDMREMEDALKQTKELMFTNIELKRKVNELGVKLGMAHSDLTRLASSLMEGAHHEKKITIN